MKEKLRDLLFVVFLRLSLHRHRAKENIIPNDASLTCRCLSVIDKSWERRYLNVKPGCFSPIRITVWSGFAAWNHMKTNLRACGAHELQRHIFFISWDATDHSLIPLCCLCKSHVAAVDIHSPARLWLDTKLSCCLHQPWLRGLSGLCSDVVWVWRRYSNKAIWVALVWNTVCVPLVAQWIRHYHVELQSQEITCVIM